MENEFSQDNTEKQTNRKGCIEVSAQLFLKNGIESVRMTDIAYESGVGVATIYRYFGTKTGITIAAMTYIWNDAQQDVQRHIRVRGLPFTVGHKTAQRPDENVHRLYQAHPAFMRLLAEFDLMLI